MEPLWLSRFTQHCVGCLPAGSGMCSHHSRSERSLQHKDEKVTKKTGGTWQQTPMFAGNQLWVLNSDRVLGVTWRVALGGRATQGHAASSWGPQSQGVSLPLGHTCSPVTFLLSASTCSGPVTCLQTAQRFGKSHDIHTMCSAWQNKTIRKAFAKFCTLTVRSPDPCLLPAFLSEAVTAHHHHELPSPWGPRARTLWSQTAPWRREASLGFPCNPALENASSQVTEQTAHLNIV